MSRISLSSVPPPLASSHRHAQLELARRRIERQPLRRRAAAPRRAAQSGVMGAAWPAMPARLGRPAAEDEVAGGRRGQQRHAPGARGRAPPGGGGSGSQTSVTRVLPFSPRSVPNPRPHVLPGLHRRRDRRQRRLTGLATSGVGVVARFNVRGRQRPDSPCARGRRRRAASRAP